MELRRLERRGLREEQSSVIGVGADLASELLTPDDGCLLAQLVPLLRHLHQVGDLRGMVREEERARAGVVAVDRVLRDDLFDEGVGVEHAVDELRAERAVSLRERAVPELELRDHHPAVPGARPGAHRASFDEHDIAASARQLCRRCEPAVAATDDEHVATIGEWLPLLGPGHRRQARMPERLLHVVGRQRGRGRTDHRRIVDI